MFSEHDALCIMHTIEFDGSEPLGFEIKIEIFECLADSESSFAERKSLAVSPLLMWFNFAT